MKKSKLTKYLIPMMFLLGTTSCSDWLDVKMNDRIMENNLFSNDAGYTTALNGVYKGLNGLYTDLSCVILDVMAQYYNVTTDDDHAYKIYANYQYSDASFESKNESVWKQMYELIGNINVILEHCDDDNVSISEGYYPIVKGEALALRAMLHFDLLRLYGPVPTDGSASTITCIPYQESTEKEVQPLIPANEILEKVIRDLNAAAGLLENTDPILEGTAVEVQQDDGTSGNRLAYRQLRLNYFAVKALLARVYLWKGDKGEAYRIAKNEIIDRTIKQEDKGVFSWITQESYEDEKKADYMFSSEVIFALYNSARYTNVYNRLFSKSLNRRKNRLTFIGSSYDASKIATFYDDPNDWRRNMWKVAEPTEEELKDAEEFGYEAMGSLYLDKYKDFESGVSLNGTEIFRYMIPMIRMSEVFLIAAECTNDNQEAQDLVNELRLHRNCMNTGFTAEEKSSVILSEFAREVLGEGQLFFYYKRLGMRDLITGTSMERPTYRLESLSSYVWPLPKAETDKRVDLTKGI